MYERKEVGEEKEHHGIYEEGRIAVNFRSLVAYIVVDSTEKQSDGYVSGQSELGQVLESDKITMVLKLRRFKIIPALILYWAYVVHCGPGISVGIGTGYGLDGPGIESRWGRDFPHLSRLVLRPSQPPVQCVPGLSRR